MSLEGIVSKQAAAHYTSGRTDSWTKSKCRAGHEGGWNSNGTQFRSLMAGVYRGDLRNDPFSTESPPLSPRARPHAPVSMPITWPQVKHGLDPMQYTIHTVPQLLKQSKAWSDYCDAERPLLESIAKLEKQTKLVRAA